MLGFMSNPEIEEKIREQLPYQVSIFIDSSKIFDLDWHFSEMEVRPLASIFGGGHLLLPRLNQSERIMMVM
jgi:hypothetical protein